MDGISGLTPAARWGILGGICAAVISAVVALGPAPMPLAYHNFADKRAMFGVANGFDVLSNAPFFIVGVLGLFFALRRESGLNPQQRWCYGAVFAGLALTCFGSAYYHLAPDNARLVYDRLPMTLGMAGFIGVLLTDRFGRIGIQLLPVLAVAGAATVLQWDMSERQGHGDVRWYALYQGLAFIIGVGLLILFPSPRESAGAFAIAVAGNIAAKLFELLDKPIFALGGIVSGHTLKHLSAGLAFIPLVVMLARSRRKDL